ncbi:MAG: S41 family peptidase [Candidatus Parcubacteria bacterium]|nr:S41 family peptidase [Candidatus Parcubacteria bacterium]
MNTHFEKYKTKILIIFFSLLLASCFGLTTKIDPEISQGLFPATQVTSTKVIVSNPNNISYACPNSLQKLCGAYSTIQNRYIRRIPDDELTTLFIKGVSKELGETLIKDIRPASFVCAPHTQKLCDAYDTIQNRGSKRIPDAKLTEMFIQGVVKEISATDPYSRYIPLGGTDPHFSRYSGVGLVTDKSENFPSPLIVRRAIEGAPAYRAGIKRGDKIISINGISTANKTQKESTELIKGNAGTMVKLAVKQGCSEKTRIISLKREKINDINSGKVTLIDERYAYVHIADFTGNPAERVRSSLVQAMIGHNNIKGLIIDLRDNPGGSVMQSVKFVGLFVEKGDALYEKNQDEKYIPWQIPDGSRDIIPGKHIVVLTNEDSASASELFSGAMKDFGRATIVGTTTYGKGVMQTTLFLKDKSQLILTIAYTFTPNKTAIHKVGISPDIVVQEGTNESCTGDEQLSAAIKILQEGGLKK